MFRSGLFSHEFDDGTYTRQTVPGRHFFGDTQFRESKVTSDASFLGNVKARKSETQGLRVTGSLATSEDTKVHGAVSITGNIQAQATQFAGSVEAVGSVHAERSMFAEDLNVVASEVSLSKSELAKSITFNDDGKGKPPKLTLHETTVSGDVHFRGQNGTVEADAGSKILGKVIGGRVISAEATSEAVGEPHSAAQGLSPNI